MPRDAARWLPSRNRLAYRFQAVRHAYGNPARLPSGVRRIEARESSNASIVPACPGRACGLFQACPSVQIMLTPVMLGFI